MAVWSGIDIAPVDAPCCGGDYIAAIKWGTDGAELKRESGVDTEFYSGHNLALSQRDSGAVDAALAYFLGDADID